MSDRELQTKEQKDCPDTLVHRLNEYTEGFPGSLLAEEAARRIVELQREAARYENGRVVLLGTISQLTEERDRFRDIAALNALTIRDMQAMKNNEDSEEERHV
jgi:hypothetical protein